MFPVSCPQPTPHLYCPSRGRRRSEGTRRRPSRRTRTRRRKRWMRRWRTWGGDAWQFWRRESAPWRRPPPPCASSSAGSAAQSSAHQPPVQRAVLSRPQSHDCGSCWGPSKSPRRPAGTSTPATLEEEAVEGAAAGGGTCCWGRACHWAVCAGATSEGLV